MAREIKDTINIRVRNNTAFVQNVNLLGGTSDPLAIPPSLLYQWDLSAETYYGSVTATIVISTTSNPTPVTYTVQVDGYNIQAVAFALNSLNMGVFQVSGNIIYVSNDYYIYGALTVNSNAFISTWDTTLTSGGSSASNQIQLPLESTGVYNFVVDWGDGTQSTITSWNQPETLHTYAVAGIYTISILGTIDGFSFNFVGDTNKIKSVLSWGTLKLGNTGSYFSGCINLDLSSVINVLDLSGTSNFDYAFVSCTSLTTIGFVNSWNTSGITSMVSTFGGATLFNSDISSWNTSSVIDMTGTFFQASSFNQPLNNWNVSNVTTFGSMFYNATVFNKPLNSWNTGSATAMDNMFQGASSFNQPIGVWNVSNVQNMSSMFLFATLFNQNLSAWNVGNVTDFSQMFSNATSFNQPLFSIIGTNAQNMFRMFAFTPAFNQNIGSWNVTNVTDFSEMFSSATAFNQNIGTWTPTSATTFYRMFSNATSFNQTLNGWGANTNGVLDMSYMFNGATSFNQSLNSWDTSTVVNFLSMFGGATAFNGNITSWNTSSAITMQGMFVSATAFNQNISAWNVSNVTSFNATFSLATSFNQPIGTWNVSSALNMAFMFSSATAFNQNIGSWNISSVNDFSGFMQSKTDLNYSSANLDAIYNGWSLLTVQPNLVNVDFGTIKYTLAGQAGKNILTGAPNNWSISDGGI